MDAILGWWVRVFVLKTDDSEFLIQFQFSIATSAIVSRTVPVEVFSLLALLLAVICVVIVHHQMLARVSGLCQQYH